MDEDQRKRLIPLCRRVIDKFHAGDWKTISVHTGQISLINDDSRLLRSLSFGDPDYSGVVHTILYRLVDIDPENLKIIEEYVSHNYGDEGENISTAPTRSRSIVFSPSVFEVPECNVEPDLIAVMTPFAPSFEPVFEAIKVAASSSGFRVLRAKDIWLNSTVIQDIFSLIFKSQIVLCDFTGRNSNVFYEAGIAHTLGKHVVPIAQHASDIPFDLQHHRYLSYLNNKEGLIELESALATRFMSLRSNAF